MIAWSRVDYLIERGDGAARRYLCELHEPVSWFAADREEQIAARVSGALQAATGLTADAFDADWRRYVLEKYEKR
jgi:hypothetical protein